MTFSGSITLGTAGICKNNTIIIGENNGDYSGFSISSIGDLDGDGKPELIIGAYGYPSGSGQGATYIISGKTVNNNLNTGTNILLTGSNTANSGIVKLLGENNDDQSGWSVSSIGDLDADGKPELIIGAYYYYSGNFQGATYVVSGMTVNNNLNTGTNILLASFSTANSGIVKLIGENNGDQSGGISVSSIGDLDADGKPELIIGAAGYPSGQGQGATYVVSGKTINNNLNTGTNILLIDSNTANSGIVKLIGENNNDYSGISVSSIGDLDADGKEELIIGAYGYPSDNRQGATYIVSGKTINNNLNTGTNILLTSSSTANSGIVKLLGENNFDVSGYSVSSIGDLDADGKLELLIGAFSYPSNNQQGATYIVSGKTVNNNLNTGTNILLTDSNTANSGIVKLLGENNSDQSGISVSSIGDLDADGKPELIIGAFFYPSNNRQGATYVVSGKTVNNNLNTGTNILLTDFSIANSGIVKLVGENKNDFSGVSVSSIGDLDADGKEELIIGAAGYPNDNRQGTTYVIPGANLLPTCPSASPSPSLSPSLSPSPSASLSLSPSPSPSPSNSLSPSASLSPLPSNSPSSSPLLSPLPSASLSPSESPSSNLVSSSNSIALASTKVIKSHKSVKSKHKTIKASTTNEEESSSITSTTKIITPTDDVGDFLPQGHGHNLQNVDNLNVLPVGSSGKTKTTTKKATTSTGKKIKAFDHHDKAIDIDDYTPHGVDNNANLRLGRDTDSAYDSSNAEPIWQGLPVNPAQILLIQTLGHAVKNCYNKAVDWFQGRNAEPVTTTQELVSTKQVTDALSGYNNISNKLASIIQQLELDRSTDKALVSWYKESLAAHQEQGKQLLGKSVVDQKLLIDFCENIKVLAEDLNEFAQQQISSNLALSYLNEELAEVNQALISLAPISLDTAESVELLNNLHEQTPVDSIQSMLFANAVDANIYDTAMFALPMLGEVG